MNPQNGVEEKSNIEHVFTENKKILDKLKGLLQRHTIGIRHGANKYTFLYVEIDFTNNDTSKPTTIREYKMPLVSQRRFLRAL
jgi:hypothetical protein